MSDRPTPKKVIERFDRKGFLTESEFNVLRDELATTKRQRDAAVEALKMARQELDGLPHSLGYEFTHLPKIDAVLREIVERKS